ncbi:hypothetical protein RA241_000882 [Cronobacter sakazakii]|nr:hypothetical protein [Cronobacter sakazakii]EKY1956026.1 hypothetical protein [Cronobacter sakazakii]EKY1959577.1 hypothetical protein [Cronobacter sakazakii]EKY1965740.1 hypothetical protein [Cronobacter sakazakii]EKY1969952.1 hypothetical protein [Cronobacter sakazakii]
MSELNELIASEIADFFAGFGGPGEPDIQSGEAQRLLTERVLSVLALRERAEPVAYADPQAFRNFQAGTATKEWVWAKPAAGLVPVFVEAPPAPFVPEDVLAALRKVAKIRLDFNDFDGDRRGMANCLGEAEEALIEVVNRRAAMLATPGKEG